MAEVYWIRKAEHTDILSQGYVGITSSTTAIRYKAHIKAAKRKDRKLCPIQFAILKYGNELIVTTVCVCSNDYANWLENRLRPTSKIGWNILAGGDARTSIRELKPVNHSEDSIVRMKYSQTLSWSDNRTNKLKGLKRSSLIRHVDAAGEPIAFWRNRYSRTRASHLLCYVNNIFDDWVSNAYITSNDILLKYSIDIKHCAWVGKMLRTFRGGWIPHEDKNWLHDYGDRKCPTDC